jgi:hypothetical protein
LVTLEWRKKAGDTDQENTKEEERQIVSPGRLEKKKRGRGVSLMDSLIVENR